MWGRLSSGLRPFRRGTRFVAAGRLVPRMQCDSHQDRRALDYRIQAVVLAGCVIPAALGILVLVGWRLNLDVLTSFFPGGERTRPKAALALLISALSLWLLRDRDRRGVPGWLGVAGAWLVMAIGGVSMLERLTGRDFELGGRIYAAVTGLSPGLVDLSFAPATAFSFMFLGASLLLRDRLWRGHSLGQWLTLIPLVTSALVVIGYGYGVQPLFQLGHDVAMALPTATGVLAINVGLLAVRPDRRPVAIFLARDVGGYVARRILPVALLAPPLLGWLRLAGERVGLYGTGFGTAAFASANMLVLLVVIAAVVRRLSEVDRRRMASEASLSKSESEYRALFELTAAGVAVAEPTGRLVRMNRRYCKILGYTEAELREKTVLELTHPDDRPLNLRHFERVLAGEAADFTFEKRYLHKQGHVVWVEAGVSAVRDSQGRLGHWVAIVHDITERKRVQETLRETEQRYELAVLATSDAIWDWNLTNDALVWNEGMRTLFGHAMSEIRPDIAWWDEHLRPADRDRVVSGIHAVIDGGGTFWRDEYAFRRRDGTYADVLDRGYVIRDGSGRAVRMIGAMQDLTDLKRTERQLRESRAELEAALSSMTEAMVVCDSTGRFLHLNDAFVTFHRFRSRAECCERAEQLAEFLDAILPDGTVAPPRMLPVARALRGEQTTNAEYTLRRRDTGEAWVGSYSFAPVRSKEDLIVGAVVVGRDITEARRAQDQLRRNHDTFYQLIQNNPFGVYVVDADFRMRQVSLGAQKVFSNLQPVIGRDFAQVMRFLWPAEFAEDAIARFRHTLETGEPYVQPSMVEKREDIDVVEAYDWRIERIALPDGRFGVVCHFYDLSERQQWEAALRESEERFRAVADNIPQLAWMTNANGGMVWFNRRWCDYTGKSLEQMRVDGWASVHHPEHFARVFSGWTRQLQAGEPWEDTFPLRSRTGEYRWFLSRARPIRDEHGTVSRWFGSNTDITEYRATQKALAEAKAQLEQHARDLERTVAERTARLTETVRELEAFSYSLSHDMREPLRAMKGFSEILESDFGPQLGAVGRGYLRRISAAAGRLDQLIRDVLTYSRIVREQVRLQPIDLDRLAHQLIDENPVLQPPQADVSLASPLEPVLGHEAYLMQVISNLVYNAVKFVAPGQRPVVRIWTESSDTEVRLYVRDNGIGIPAEAQERMFGMFERMHGEKAYEGTGIGLTIVRKAVERMGGSVGVQSAPNQGSTFWVALGKPAARAT